MNTVMRFLLLSSFLILTSCVATTNMSKEGTSPEKLATIEMKIATPTSSDEVKILFIDEQKVSGSTVLVEEGWHDIFGAVVTGTQHYYSWGKVYFYGGNKYRTEIQQDSNFSFVRLVDIASDQATGATINKLPDDSVEAEKVYLQQSGH